ncbi:MAG TPA: hypothetical protein VH374_07495 [Polyangia bacterium]|nr:hypothetical protein [Polyangia bacterium]
MNTSLPPSEQATVLTRRRAARRTYIPAMAPAWHRVPEVGIRVTATAMTAIAAVILIFAIVTKGSPAAGRRFLTGRSLGSGR